MLLSDPARPGPFADRMAARRKCRVPLALVLGSTRPGNGPPVRPRRDRTAISGGGTVGPDALEMTVETWQRCCAATSRAIKIVLLDQRTVAGIGNLYASEILHVSRIHPAQRADRLKPAELSRLKRRGPLRARGSHSRRRIDAERRHLPHGAQSEWPLSAQAPRLRPRRCNLPHVLKRRDPPDRPGTAIDFLSAPSARGFSGR